MSNTKNIFIGVDNGISGAIAVYDSETNTMLPSIMPIIKTPKANKKGMKSEYDIQAILNLLKLHASSTRLVILERAQSMPGQGVASMFSIGKNYGITQGLLSALEIPYQIVSPQTWQKKMFEGVSHAKGESKGASVLVAQRLFPSTNFLGTEKSTVLHNGMTDASLMAYYGYLTYK